MHEINKYQKCSYHQWNNNSELRPVHLTNTSFFSSKKNYKNETHLISHRNDYLYRLRLDPKPRFPANKCFCLVAGIIRSASPLRAFTANFRCEIFNNFRAFFRI